MRRLDPTRGPASRRPAALGVLALVMVAAAAFSQDAVKPLEEQIELSRRRLEQIREEQRRLRSEMSALAAAVHDVQAEVDNLNQQTRNQEALLRELDQQLAIRDQQILATTADLLQTQDRLIEKKVLFARRARDLYKRGPLAGSQALLAAESFSDLINRYQYLYLVALHDRLLVQQIEELKNRLEEQYGKLRGEVQGLRDVRSSKVREIQELYRLEQERSRRLTAVRGMRATAERKLEKLKRDEGELNGLIARLEREREAAEILAASGPTSSTLVPSSRGRLDWPVEGRILYRFGQQRNQDGTAILRNGIGIAAEEGTPVRAVADGTVSFSESAFGYGPSVILSHGGGNYSLYLYLSEIAVAPGERVTAGQAIGRVGGAGTPEGPHLQFQIRIKGQAVDPIPWLRRASG